MSLPPRPCHVLLAFPLALTLLVAACDGSGVPPRSPVAPTPPASTPPTAGSPAGQLRGSVVDSSWTALDDARVEVLDGVAAGTWTASDSAGNFTLPGVARTDTLRVTKDGYVPTTRAAELGGAIVLASLAAPVSVAGRYALTIAADASCTGLPEGLRTRTYTATIDDTRFGHADVEGGTFPDAQHHFIVLVAGDRVRFSTQFDDYPYMVERVADNAYLAIYGSGQTTVHPGAATIAVAFDGWIEYCETTALVDGSHLYQCTAPVRRARCTSRAHEWHMTRR